MTILAEPETDLLIDGSPESRLPADDRGLAYGDGLFETIACDQGRFLLWERHLQRLRAGCERLALPVPDTDALRVEAERLRRSRLRGVLKILLTRGSGGRGYCPPEPPRPRRILSWHALPAYTRTQAESGVRVRDCRIPMPIQPRLAGLKHCNRLDQVLARAEWRDEAIAEGLMYDPDGRAIGGVMSNLFLVRDGRLLTPDLSRAGVAGCMRAEILPAATALNLEVQITDIRRADVAAADELFLTNSLFGFWPVREWAGLAKAVGPWTRRLQSHCLGAWPTPVA